MWKLTETLKSDWALEMAKSVAVEMIKSTKKPNAAETGQGTPSPSPPSQSSPGLSVEDEAGGGEVPAEDVEAPSAGGSGALGSRI